MRTYLLYILIFSFLSASPQNQTVGLFKYEPGTFTGYTLFSSGNNTYLIDNCGRRINTWSSSYKPGLSVYLLENGDLLRTCRIQSTIFGGGGSGGRVERRDWNNNLIWSYDFSSSLYHQHHDIEFMPNGNILVLCWEYRTYNEAVSAGRDPNAIIDGNLFPTYIIEVEPQGTNNINIVWEWRIWDHLIQDFDSLKNNYGNVAAHPELLDINFYNGNGKNDWLHCNSIDYNPQLDQILICSRALSEIYIIDHSTTTAEAASHSGGNYGKGGDILYRWGNPQVYRQGSLQRLFGQHQAEWITHTGNDDGKISIFNNGQGRDYSSVDIIDPPQNSNGEYYLNLNNIFGPDTAEWSYAAPNPLDFYADHISGAQRLPNGNTLICHGTHGTFFEIDNQKNVLWNYISPITNTGPLVQGFSIPSSANSWANSTFRATKYSKNYPAFNGLNLTPGAPLELLPFASTCSIINSIYNIDNQRSQRPIKILDLLGRPTKHENNKVLIYIYDDGKVEKKLFLQ